MSNKDLLDNIKKLREMTGVGFKDCKIALDETSGDIDKSIEFLRKKGIAKASKKMSRTASEGLALVKNKDGQISIIEVNSETDFAAKSEAFLSFLDEIGNFVLENNNPNLNIEELLSLQFKNTNISDYLNSMIAKIGENLVLSELKIFEKTYGVENASIWFQRWRIFFMSCEKLFGYNSGREWGVSHYRFAKR